MTETGLSAGDENRFWTGYFAATPTVEIHFRWTPPLTGLSDEFVLEAAVNAGGVPLVTQRMRDFVMAAERLHPSMVTSGQTYKIS